MATRTRPFTSTRTASTAVALASAAAIVVAAPGLTPAASTATNALSRAAYELTTFSDVFTVPAEVWTNVLFGSDVYGGFVGPQNTPIAVEPWASSCNYDCYADPGIPGVSYIFFDALVNGNGNGWADRSNWGVGIVNYFYEPFFQFAVGGGASNFTVQTAYAGFSAATAYLLQATLGQASPVLSTIIQLAFYGPYLVTLAWDNAWNLIADTAAGIPVVGRYISDSINAYLGELETPGSTPDNPLYYTAGLSGILQYWTNVLTGTEPQPAPPPGAARSAATATLAAAETAVSSPAEVAADVADVAGAAPGAESAPVAESDAADHTSGSVEAEGAAVTEASDAAAADAPAVTTTADAAADAAGTAAAETAPAPAPAKATSKRPIRDAVEKAAAGITAGIASALRGPKAAAAKSADTKADATTSAG